MWFYILSIIFYIVYAYYIDKLGLGTDKLSYFIWIVIAYACVAYQNYITLL